MDVVRPGGGRRWHRPRVVTSNQPRGQPAWNGTWICSSVRGCGSIDRATRFHCVILRTDGRSAQTTYEIAFVCFVTRARVAWRWALFSRSLCSQNWSIAQKLNRTTRCQEQVPLVRVTIFFCLANLAIATRLVLLVVTLVYLWCI